MVRVKKHNFKTSKKSLTKLKKVILKKPISFQKIVSQIKKQIHKYKPDNVNDAIQTAVKYAKTHLLQKKKNYKKDPPRIIKVPKRGGILPLIPIFAGLSALGALAGGASGIAKAVTNARAAKQQLDESQRHNRTMESIALGKGMYLQPYKSGLGIFLNPYTSRPKMPNS